MGIAAPVACTHNFLHWPDEKLTQSSSLFLSVTACMNCRGKWQMFLPNVGAYAVYYVRCILSRICTITIAPLEDGRSPSVITMHWTSLLTLMILECKSWQTLLIHTVSHNITKYHNCIDKYFYWWRYWIDSSDGFIPSMAFLVVHAGVVTLIAYLSRLAMPKVVISSGGEEFFLPDDSQYFWNDVQGEKYRR